MGRPSTREKLLDCAELLFAEHGIEGVSLRAINTSAGLSPAALHYHFGTKQALIEALLERRMPVLMEGRQKLLDELSASPAPSTRQVLGAVMQPLVDFISAQPNSGLRYLRLLHRLHSDGDLDHAFVIARWPGAVDRLAPLLQRANPDLPRATVEFRLSLVINVLLQSLAGRAPREGDLETYASALLDFLTHGFDAPISGVSA